MEPNKTLTEELAMQEEKQTLSVREIARHEDGSATYAIDASEEDMKKLFEIFFVSAVTEGIKAANSNTEAWLAERKVLELADKLVRYLDVWETADEFDYVMGVKDVKNELKEALKKAGI